MLATREASINPDGRKASPLQLIVCKKVTGYPSFRFHVRPAKAGLFSGSQSHQGKSQTPVACMAA
jgi:hypothetical protein